MKTRWFKRLQQNAGKISPHIRFKRIRNGFYRIFWDSGYIGEVYENLPENGYDIEDYDQRLEERSYIQDKMDDGEIQRKIKNFVEGFHEANDTIRTRTYLVRNDYEANKTIMDGYKQIRLK